MLIREFIRLAGSVRAAFALSTVLVLVLAAASVLEAERGRDASRWYVYGAWWFLALLGLMGGHALAALVIRWPWKGRHGGFVISYLGLLAVLAGALLTLLVGVEGEVVLGKGSGAEDLRVLERSAVTIVRSTAAGPSSTEYSFQPGFGGRNDGRTVEFDDEQGLGISILRFYRRSKHTTRWVAADGDYDGAALCLQLTGPGGHLISEEWLTGNRYGGEAVVGPTKYEILPLTTASMRDDFLHPPAEGLGEAGVLSVHHEGHMTRLSVDELVGERFRVGKSDIEVEIERFLPNARPTPDGRFVSPDGAAGNPLLELRIHPPNAEPIRQIALAKKPLLNLDAVNGRPCPVKFWYHHSAVKRPAGAVFLQAPDGTLYCRPVADGTLASPVVVEEGSSIGVGAGFKVVVKRYLPRARQESFFEPVDVARGESPVDSEAAALVELRLDGTKREVWLRRSDPLLGSCMIQTPRGTVTATLDYERRPLGFAVRLDEIRRVSSPDAPDADAPACTVRILDEGASAERTHEVSLGRPLSHGGFVFHQAEVRGDGHGNELIVLLATFDPGRFLKYAGSLMICGGIFLTFFSRASALRTAPRTRTDDTAHEKAHRTDRPRDAVRHVAETRATDVTRKAS